MFDHVDNDLVTNTIIDFDSTAVRRAFDCLSKVNKVIVTTASRIYADLSIYLGRSAAAQVR